MFCSATIFAKDNASATAVSPHSLAVQADALDLAQNPVRIESRDGALVFTVATQISENTVALLG